MNFYSVSDNCRNGLSEMFVAFVTSGREKYDYKTQFLGVFREEKRALQSMFHFLVQEGKLFLIRDTEEEEKAFLHYQAIFASDSMSSANELRAYLTNVCKTWSDSFYEDGWSFTIQKEVFQDSLI